MPEINQMELNAIAVPVPPLAEQRRIVAKVDQLMALVDRLEAQLAASQAIAANLLEAVVGELVAAELVAAVRTAFRHRWWDSRSTGSATSTNTRRTSSRAATLEIRRVGSSATIRPRKLTDSLMACYNYSALINTFRGFVTISKPMDRALTVLQAMGIARSRDLERAGVSRTQIRRLREQNLIERLGHGLYRSPDAALTERQVLAEAARLVPGGVICLLSALRFHGLTTQNPFEVWMAINHKAWRPRVERPPMRFVYLSGPALREGVEEHDVDGVPVHVFSAAKTVADCFKFRNKIGTDVAVEALRAFRRAYPKDLDLVWRFAEVDRMTQVILPYLEAVG